MNCGLVLKRPGRHSCVHTANDVHFWILSSRRSRLRHDMDVTPREKRIAPDIAAKDRLCGKRAYSPATLA